MVYIVMGVSGCGKTTIGRLLAARLGLDFYDADDFHTKESKCKMNKGVPLDDEDRMPWLVELAERVASWNARGGAVVACSALKEKYRTILTMDFRSEVNFICLHGDRDLILERMKKRTGHFFPLELLESQIAALEPPTDALTADISGTPEEICGRIIDKIAAIDKRNPK